MTADQFKRAREITGEIEDIEIEIEAARTMMNADSIQIIGSKDKVPYGNIRLKTEEAKEFLESLLEIKGTAHKELIVEMNNL